MFLTLDLSDLNTIEKNADIRVLNQKYTYDRFKQIVFEGIESLTSVRLDRKDYELIRIDALKPEELKNKKGDITQYFSEWDIVKVKKCKEEK